MPLKDKNGAAITSAAKAVGGQTFIAVGGKNCLQVIIYETGPSTFFAFNKVAENTDAVCTAVLASTPVKQLLDSTLPNSGKADGTEHCTGISNGQMSCVAITSGKIY